MKPPFFLTTARLEIFSTMILCGDLSTIRVVRLGKILIILVKQIIIKFYKVMFKFNSS